MNYTEAKANIKLALHSGDRREIDIAMKAYLDLKFKTIRENDEYVQMVKQTLLEA